MPVFNYCTVNNMRFVAFLDTEEVAGSNPVVPTIFINNLQQFGGNLQPEIQPEIPQYLQFAHPRKRSAIAQPHHENLEFTADLSRNEVAGFNCRESASEERLHSWMLRRLNSTFVVIYPASIA